MFRLRTLGGASLESASDRPLDGATPRRLAVLAILAIAGRRGISRDRVLGLLWPESDQDRARHALVQTLYALRRDLGADVVTGAADLRLNAALVESDVGRFEDAIAAGALEEAAELYAGPFLDGFYVSGAPEFEVWSEGQRARLRAAALVAMERLAHQADDGADPSRALRWWNRLTEAEPLSAKHALGHMRALIRAGDRAGAIAHGLRHAELVKRELEAPPDAEVLTLVAELRQPPRIAATVPHAALPGRDSSPAAAPAAVPLGAPATNASGRWHGRRAVLLGAAIAVAILGAGTAVARARARATTEPVILAVGRITVLTAPESVQVARVMRDMLTTGLGNITGVRVVANSRLFEILTPGEDTASSALARAARAAGAREILEGDVTYAPQGGLQLTLRRVGLDDGMVERGYRASALDRVALVDSAIAVIARDLGAVPPASGIADVTTRSPAAYGLYEEGLRAFYQFDLAAALRLMESALVQDSSFGMAAYYAAWSATLLNVADAEQHRTRARELAGTLPERQRLRVLAQIGVWQHDPSASSVAETLAVRYPSDADAHLILGSVRSWEGEWEQARRSLERVIVLDSTQGARPGGICRVCFAFSELNGVLVAWDSLDAAVRSARRWSRFSQDDRGTDAVLASLYTRQHRFDEARQAWDRAAAGNVVPSLGEERMRLALASERYDEVDAQARMAMSSMSAAERDAARWLHLISLRNQGRHGEARRVLHDARDRDLFNLAVLALETGRADSAARTFRRLAAGVSPARPAGVRARETGWYLTLVGTALFAAGDTSGVRRLADSVRAISMGTLVARVRRAPEFLDGLLLQQQGRHEEAARAFRRSVVSYTEGYSRANYELAGSLIALGRAGEAIYPLQAALRSPADGAALYLTRTEAHARLAEAFALAGQRDSAAAHHRAVATAWAQADAPLRARRDASLRWLRDAGYPQP